jgi:hypothetical protein
MSALRQHALPIMTSPRAGEEVQEEATPEELLHELEQKSVRDLLVQAQELFNVRDPANERITGIKTVLIARLSPTFSETNQLQLFDTLDGLAFTTPDDPNVIVVQHPDIPLQFRLRKSKVSEWQVVLRTVSQEIERRTRRLENLIAIPETTRSQAVLNEIIEQRTYTEALQWVLNQVETRHHFRLTGRFVASSEHAPTQQEG